MSPMPPGLPTFLAHMLPARLPSPPPGAQLSGLIAPLSCAPPVREFARLLSSGPPLPVAFECDGAADSIAATALIRTLATGLGVPPPARVRDDLFAPAVEQRILSAGKTGLVLLSDGGRASLEPLPGVSLSSLSLAVADAAFAGGALGFPDRFVAFDVETTGLDAEREELTEIGAVRFEGGGETGVFSSFVKPSRPIPSEVTALNGITDAMVAGAPPPMEALRAFLDFAGPLPLVAHNLPFDMSFVTLHAWRLLGVEIPNPVEDTLVMSRLLYPGARNHRLVDMAAALSVPQGEWHRACSDARTAAFLYLRLKDLPPEKLRELRLLHYLPLAALGALASSAPLEGDDLSVVAFGLSRLIRHFRLDGSSVPVVGGEAPTADMLIARDEKVRRRGALLLLAMRGV